MGKSLLTLSLALLLSGCGTISGLLTGPMTGGASLTNRMLNSEEARPAVKIFGAPFTFVAGTISGIFFSTYHGYQFDKNYLSQQIGEDYDRGLRRVFDPFDSTLYR